MYSIWDRLVMGEFELLVYTLVSLFACCKDDHLKQIRNYTSLDVNLIKKFYLDEVKLLKKATKYYKIFRNNLSISNLIINYFNSK